MSMKRLPYKVSGRKSLILTHSRSDNMLGKEKKVISEADADSNKTLISATATNSILERPRISKKVKHKTSEVKKPASQVSNFILQMAKQPKPSLSRASFKSPTQMSITPVKKPRIPSIKLQLETKPNKNCRVVVTTNPKTPKTKLPFVFASNLHVRVSECQKRMKQKSPVKSAF